jgi:hypothetical protein
MNSEPVRVSNYRSLARRRARESRANAYPDRLLEGRCSDLIRRLKCGPGSPEFTKQAQNLSMGPPLRQENPGSGPSDKN